MYFRYNKIQEREGRGGGRGGGVVVVGGGGRQANVITGAISLTVTVKNRGFG